MQAHQAHKYSADPKRPTLYLMLDLFSSLPRSSNSVCFSYWEKLGEQALQEAFWLCLEFSSSLHPGFGELKKSGTAVVLTSATRVR